MFRRRYKIRVYGVPDKHLYAPLPVRALRAVRLASWQVKAALLSAGTATGLILNLVVTLWKA